MTNTQRTNRSLYRVTPTTELDGQSYDDTLLSSRDFASEDPERLVIRGLTAADLAALAAAQKAMQARVDAISPGTVVSRNAVALGILRDALSAYCDQAKASSKEVGERTPDRTRRPKRAPRAPLAPIAEAPLSIDARGMRPRLAPLDASTREALSRLHETYALASLGAAAGVSEPTVRRALAGATLSHHVRRALTMLAQPAAQEGGR